MNSEGKNSPTCWVRIRDIDLRLPLPPAPRAGAKKDDAGSADNGILHALDRIVDVRWGEVTYFDAEDHPIHANAGSIPFWTEKGHGGFSRQTSGDAAVESRFSRQQSPWEAGTGFSRQATPATLVEVKSVFGTGFSRQTSPWEAGSTTSPRRGNSGCPLRLRLLQWAGRPGPVLQGPIKAGSHVLLEWALAENSLFPLPPHEVPRVIEAPSTPQPGSRRPYAIFAGVQAVANLYTWRSSAGERGPRRRGVVDTAAVEAGRGRGQRVHDGPRARRRHGGADGRRSRRRRDLDE